jgi:hypothetical protein
MGVGCGGYKHHVSVLCYLYSSRDIAYQSADQKQKLESGYMRKSWIHPSQSFLSIKSLLTRCALYLYLEILFSHALTPVATNRGKRMGVPIPMAGICGKIFEDSFTRVPSCLLLLYLPYS